MPATYKVVLPDHGMFDLEVKDDLSIWVSNYTPGKPVVEGAITREQIGDMNTAIERNVHTGGFMWRLLETYSAADLGNRAALALGFEWLPDLHEKWLKERS